MFLQQQTASLLRTSSTVNHLFSRWVALLLGLPSPAQVTYFGAPFVPLTIQFSPPLLATCMQKFFTSSLLVLAAFMTGFASASMASSHLLNPIIGSRVTSLRGMLKLLGQGSGHSSGVRLRSWRTSCCGSQRSCVIVQVLLRPLFGGLSRQA